MVSTESSRTPTKYNTPQDTTSSIISRTNAPTSFIGSGVVVVLDMRNRANGTIIAAINTVLETKSPQNSEDFELKMDVIKDINSMLKVSMNQKRIFGFLLLLPYIPLYLFEYSFAQYFAYLYHSEGEDSQQKSTQQGSFCGDVIKSHDSSEIHRSYQGRY